MADEIVGRIRIIVGGKEQLLKVAGSMKEIVAQMSKAEKLEIINKKELNDAQQQLQRLVSLNQRLSKFQMNITRGAGVSGTKGKEAAYDAGAYRDYQRMIQQLHSKVVRELQMRTKHQTGIEKDITRKTIESLNFTRREKLNELKTRMMSGKQGMVLSRQVGQNVVKLFKDLLRVQNVEYRADLQNAKKNMQLASRQRANLGSARFAEVSRRRSYMKDQSSAYTENKGRDETAAYRENERRTRAAQMKQERRQKMMSNVGGGVKGVLGIGAGTGRALAAMGGFTMMEYAERMKQAMKKTRIENIFGPMFGNLFKIVGGLMGSTIASIFEDFGKAIGNLSELVFNLMTGVMRTVFAGITGIAKGIGRLFVGMILGPLSNVLGIMTGALVIGLSALSEIFDQLLEEITGLLKSLAQVVANVLSAGFKIAAGIVKGFANIVSGIFKGLWEGVKAMTEGFIMFMKKAMSMLASIAQQAIGKYMKLQTAGARMLTQVVDVAGQTSAKFEQLITRTTVKYGTALQDASSAIFDIVSSGYRSVAEATKLIDVSSRLAMAA